MELLSGHSSVYVDVGAHGGDHVTVPRRRRRPFALRLQPRHTDCTQTQRHASRFRCESAEVLCVSQTRVKDVELRISDRRRSGVSSRKHVESVSNTGGAGVVRPDCRRHSSHLNRLPHATAFSISCSAGKISDASV